MPENDQNRQLDGSLQVHDDSMPAEFGLPMAIFVVLASMVGVGVLTTSGYTVALVGSNQWMLGLWVVGGVIAVCGALTLAELSAALPHTGGDYVYLYEAYGPLAAFLSGWVSFLIGFSGPCAASAFAASKYVLAPLQLEGTRAVLIQRILATLLHPASRGSPRLGTRADGAACRAVITSLKLLVLGLHGGRGPGGRVASFGQPVRRPARRRRPCGDDDVLARLHLLRLHGLERGVLPRGRDSQSPEGPPAGDPPGHRTGHGALPGPERRLRPGALRGRCPRHGGRAGESTGARRGRPDRRDRGAAALRSRAGRIRSAWRSA